MPSEPAQYSNAFAPPVRGTGDYLTARAANPRTGLISPSVCGESEDAAHKPSPLRREAFTPSLPAMHEHNNLEAASWRIPCPRSTLEVPAHLQERRLNGPRQQHNRPPPREANQAVPRVAIPTVKIASPNGSTTVWRSESMVYKRPILSHHQIPFDPQYHLSPPPLPQVQRYNVPYGQHGIHLGPQVVKSRKHIRFEERKPACTSDMLVRQRIPPRKPVPEPTQDISHEAPLKSLNRSPQQAHRSKIGNNHEDNDESTAPSPFIQGITNPDLAMLINLFSQLVTFITSSCSWILALKPSFNTIHIRQDRQNSADTAVELRLPSLKECLWRGARLLFVLYVMFCLWRTLELLLELLALMFLPLKLVVRIARWTNVR